MVGEGADGGAEAPPFQDFAATSMQAIFTHGGEPKDHEVFAQNDSFQEFFRSPFRSAHTEYLGMNGTAGIYATKSNPATEVGWSLGTSSRLNPSLVRARPGEGPDCAGD